MALTAPILNVRDTISGAEAECYVVVNGERKWCMNAKNLTATYEKEKTEIKVLGSRNSKNKANGGKGTGSATFYYNSSTFRELMYEYKQNGVDFYFEMYITNEDSTSSVGRQTTILKDCNLDSVVVAAFDVDAGQLEEDLAFTFDDWELAEKFKEVEGMV